MRKIISFKKGVSILNNFKKRNVLVVGDLMLDHFIWGRVSRISPEAPVPVVKVISENVMLGGAANVVNNINSLNGNVLVCGVIGNDEGGRSFVSELKKKNIPADGLIIDKKRTTIIKTRIIAHHQQVVRFDREDDESVNLGTMKSILDYVRKKINSVDALLVSDYAKGVVSEELFDELVSLARKKRKIITVDPKVRHFDFYKNVTIVTPNNDEASRASGVEIKDNASLLRAGEILLNRLGSDAMLITRGEHGMSLFEKDGSITHIPTVAKEVYDVTGAGDTVISVLALTLAAGATFKEAAVISNFAAGIVVGKLGTATVTPKELKDALKEGLKR
ncbi:MAG TPA: D-glycero-beta-D-manno-heptose-7-phosphate kinase [Deltaproteobacteria bacterium]|nr:D-glycero-beta-D-manno-heptose-7-phosphate kinase [Deltaproteobacteria bacterium]